MYKSAAFYQGYQDTMGVFLKAAGAEDVARNSVYALHRMVVQLAGKLQSLGHEIPPHVQKVLGTVGGKARQGAQAVSGAARRGAGAAGELASRGREAVGDFAFEHSADPAYAKEYLKYIAGRAGQLPGAMYRAHPQATVGVLAGLGGAGLGALGEYGLSD